MLSINTNLSSLIAQNSLKTSTNNLDIAIERMTTGAKINHAKDNAANYSIATNMSTKISAYQVAEDNCAMGLNLVSTAEESLNLIQDKLQRLRDLQEQASNGTYGEDSLKAINAECNALVDEINRIYDTAEYNDRKLFRKENIQTNAISTYAQPRIVTTETGFIKEITQRDTSEMTKLGAVDINTAISSGTYSISSAEELAKLATMTNNGLVTGGEFVLANNIDLSRYSNWTPIGYSDEDVLTPFKASFDGNGYVISNLTITESTPAVGLFGLIDGVIKNLGIEDAYINIKGDSSSVGILAGMSAETSGDTTIAKTSVIQNCYTTGAIVANINNGNNESAGGLVGANCLNLLKFDSCYTAVDMKIDGADFVGGIIGSTLFACTDIQNCYTTGNIVVNNTDTDPYIGGLAGLAWMSNGSNGLPTSIKNSFATGSLTSTSSKIGGLVGSLALFGYSGCISGCAYNSVNSKGIGDDTYGYGASGVVAKSESELKAMIPTLYKYYGGASSGITMSDIVLQVGINSDKSSQISFNTSLELGNIYSLRGIGVNTITDYLSKIDSMLEKISTKQTELGAVSNRLESALEQISVSYENLVSSLSTIQDADIGEVSSEYLRQQILQQASATLMATANQSPAIALQLL